MAQQKKLRLGFIGLGQATAHVIGELRLAEGLPWEIAAAADPRPHATAAFQKEFGGQVYADAEALCRESDVDVVYIATPPWMHLEHTLAAAKYGKHVIVEKPMALSLADCRTMVAAAQKAGIKLMAGHTHSFDAPIRKIYELVSSGQCGALRMINSWNFNEFMHRPRLLSELEANHGPVLNQGPHQVDVVRQIGGGLVKSVRATTIPDGVTGVEGGYTVYLQFESGVPATLVYDGRSLFDTAELFWWSGEGGQARDPGLNARRRAAYLELAKLPKAERQKRLDADKEKGRYGAATSGHGSKPYGDEVARVQPFFGLTVVSCEDATIRQSPQGLLVYGNKGIEELPIGHDLRGRLAELNEMYEGIVEGRRVFHDGAWGTATLEVCFAILESAKTGQEIAMHHQVATE
jgi:phthalate 4,5-cis-dihydrodiol dehydrogenase